MIAYTDDLQKLLADHSSFIKRLSADDEAAELQDKAYVLGFERGKFELMRELVASADAAIENADDHSLKNALIEFNNHTGVLDKIAEEFQPTIQVD